MVLASSRVNNASPLRSQSKKGLNSWHLIAPDLWSTPYFSAWRCPPTSPRSIFPPQTRVCVDQRQEKLSWSRVLLRQASRRTPSPGPSTGWRRRPWSQGFASRCTRQLRLRDTCKLVRSVWPDQTKPGFETALVLQGLDNHSNRKSTCTNYFTFATSESLALRLDKEPGWDWGLAKQLLRPLPDWIATS